LSKQQGKQLYSRRSFILATGKVALSSVLIGRLFYLQVWQSDHYKTLSKGNRVRLDFTTPLRGIIRDRKGEILADNVKDFRLVMVREETPDVDYILTRVSSIIQLDPKTQERLFENIKKSPRFIPISIQENLNWEQVAELEVRAPEISGTYVEEGFKRRYELGPGMAHVLGYVQTPDVEKAKENMAFRLPGSKVGKIGIEKYYDEHLLGTPGFSEIEVNARRQVVRELNHHPSVSGNELQLTIDKQLQSQIYERLVQEKSASASVISVPSGEVLAMVSVPGFDPNQFVTGVKTDLWQEWLNSPYKPLLNKVTQAEYSPGSIFKLLVGLAGLEHNVMSPDEHIHCSGYMELGSHRFHCHKKHGHGSENLTTAIRDSCDIYFYEIAKRLGIEKISAMANKMGFGFKTGLELQDERSGLMPTKAWKKEKHNKSWTTGETVIAGIGQGYLLVTPLQLALFGCRLATNKQVIPTLIKPGDQCIREFEDLGISETSRNQILKGMDMAVNSPQGTAYRAHMDIDGWTMAGKTSTTQVRRVSRQERLQKEATIDPWHLKDHAMFMGYAPVNNPKYVLALVIEHGGWSSQAAVPVVKDLIAMIHAYDLKGGK
jgi:penicillin-binding protein 2